MDPVALCAYLWVLHVFVQLFFFFLGAHSRKLSAPDLAGLQVAAGLAAGRRKLVSMLGFWLGQRIRQNDYKWFFNYTYEQTFFLLLSFSSQLEIESHFLS